MALTLYWASGSPFAWSVMLALACKGLPCESRRLDMSQGEHKTPQFLALNPRGKVPVLVDGDAVITESLAILAYVDALQPEPPLFGTGALACARVMEALSSVMSYLEPALFPIPMQVFFKPWDEAGQDAVRRAIPAALAELEKVEAVLAGHDALAGSDLSVADLRLYPVLRFFWRAWIVVEKKGGVPELASLQRDRFPAIDGWCGRIEALPGFADTVPPHWVRKD